ncbi:MAG: DUF4832 domain-containing protein [bacterium]
MNGCGAASTAPKSACEQGMVSVHPEVNDEVLINPGMGFESFNRSGDAPIDGDGWYPKSSIAYHRWYLDEIWPKEGKIDFQRIDAAIADAKRCGQLLAFRIMAGEGTRDPIPAWLHEKGLPGVEFDNGFVPDFNSPMFLEYLGRLAAGLGKYCDGNPWIAYVDVGGLGLWGEWHITGATGAKPILHSTENRVIDLFVQAFPHSILVLPINSMNALQHASALGLGWRADCYGDLGGFSPTWNHMQSDAYPLLITSSGVEGEWKKAPVLFETCWDIPFWVNKGWDIDYILAWGLKYHISVLNAKSVGIPPELRPKIEEFQKKMGYRFVCRELCHTASVARGGILTMVSRWENVGVAPPYLPMTLRYRLRDTTGHQTEFASDAEIRTWLPGGVRRVTESFTVPATLPTGSYAVEVAIQCLMGEKPNIALSIAGSRPANWYRLSDIIVQ